MRETYRLSTLNDGRFGNAGETDADAVRYAKVLARMIESAFPNVEVELVQGFVSYQPCPYALADEIQYFVNENYVAAISRADSKPKARAKVRS